MNSFSDRLYAARSRRGLTRGQLAIKAKLSAEQVRDYENRKTLPQIDKLYRLAKALKVSADWLIGLREEKECIEKS